MVFEPVPNARFRGVVVTTTNFLPSRLPRRTHTDGERIVLIRNYQLLFEHCEATQRFRIVALNENDLNAQDRREQDELDSVFFYVTAETVLETRDTCSSTGEHLGGRTTVRSSTNSNTSINFQMGRADNHTLNLALDAAREFLIAP
jgi:hypothetical protein